MKNDTRTFLSVILGVPLALTGVWGIHEAQIQREAPVPIVEVVPAYVPVDPAPATSTPKKVPVATPKPIVQKTPEPVAIPVSAPAPVVVASAPAPAVAPVPVVHVVKKSRQTRAS